MINLLIHLQSYASFFAERNRNALIQIELGGRILSYIIPMINHGFVKGLAEMVHQKRKYQFPDCDQDSDWFRAERVFYKTYVGCALKLLAIKCVLLAGYWSCIERGEALPGIDCAMHDLGVNDAVVIESLKSLNPSQCNLLFKSACSADLSISMIELFLRREITQLFLENEPEIMSQFKLSC